MRKEIVKAITFISALSFMVSASCLDSENMIVPLLVMLVSFVWMGLVAYANGLILGTNRYIEVKGENK